ncbi:MAG: hypothetical protein U0R78_10945 [Nocardioidaceae bacterium]
MDDFESRLSDALHRGVDTLTPPVDRLVGGGVTRAHETRRRRRRWLATGTAAVAVMAAAAATTYAVLGGADDLPTVTERPTASCQPVDEGVIPAWARTGFSDPEPRVAHVMSDHGRIVAILFGRRLFAPPSSEVNNKILWVAEPTISPGAADGGPSDLTITARLGGPDLVVHRTVAGGPGPSIVDLPRAGCWQLSLRWGDGPQQQDTMSLAYASP